MKVSLDVMPYWGIKQRIKIPTRIEKKGYYSSGKIGRKIVFFTGGGFTVTQSRTKVYQSKNALLNRIKIVNKARIKKGLAIPKNITVKKMGQPKIKIFKRPIRRIIKRPIRRPVRQPIKLEVSKVKTKNQQRFIAWTKKTFPKLYQAALLDIKTKKSLEGIGDFFSDLTSSLTDLAPAYLQFKQQKDLMKMQLKRAKAGLPPANVADYTPVIKTRIDLAPATRTALVGGMKDMIMPIAIGGGILLVVMAMRKRR